MFYLQKINSMKNKFFAIFLSLFIVITTVSVVSGANNNTTNKMCAKKLSVKSKSVTEQTCYVTNFRYGHVYSNGQIIGYALYFDIICPPKPGDLIWASLKRETKYILIEESNFPLAK